MRRLALLLALTACSHGSPPATSKWAAETHTQLAADDEPPPSYDPAELDRTLTAERAAALGASGEIAQLEAGDPETLRTALADLGVRRRFIATLEVCKAQTRMCPPRLDDAAWTLPVDSDADPKLDVPLRFDLGSWQKVAAELHGRACACRTLACVDSLDVTIERLEKRPMAEVQADDVAGTSIVRARECLMRLRGRKGMPRLAAADDE